MMDQKELYDKYNVERHYVILENAYLASINANRKKSSKDVKVGNIVNSFSIGRRIMDNHEDDSYIIGRILVKVGTGFKVEGEIAEYSVEVEGIFVKDNSNLEAKDIDQEKFRKVVFSLLVPILLPYARAALTTISGLCNTPNIYLPSLDIIKSLEKNTSNNEIVKSSK